MTTPVQGGIPFPSVTKQQIDASTVQALVELIYVQTANDILGSSLASLDSALQATQSALRILNQIQNLHNKIQVQSRSAFNFNYRSAGAAFFSSIVDGKVVSVTVNASLYAQEYNQAASAYFGQPVDPKFIFESAGAPGFTQFQTALQQLRQQLGQEISTIARITPPNQDPGQQNTLLSTLRVVYNDMPTSFDYNTVSQWVLDKYNLHGDNTASMAGQIQNNLTFAITAAESLNDAQKEKVRRYLFIFQEYYQSASAVLSKVNTIIEQMAQKIAG